MKKLFVLLLALAMVTGAAFAQATINGYARVTGTIAEDGTFSYADKLRLNLGWTAEDEMVKFGARLETTSTDASIDVDGDTVEDFALGDVSIGYLYGMIKLADGMFAVTAGKITNTTYDISSGYSDYAAVGNVANGGSLFGAKGMLFELMPMDAFTVGLMAYPDGADLGIGQFGLNAKYALEGIGNIVLSSNFADPFDTSALSASFQLTMVEGLTASLGYKGLATNGVYAIVLYEMDALAAEVAAEMNFDNDLIYVEGYAAYTMGDVTLVGLFGFNKDAIDPDNHLGTDELWFSGEVYYNVGKGQFVLAAQYGDVSGFALPIVVKVSF